MVEPSRPPKLELRPLEPVPVAVLDERPSGRRTIVDLESRLPQDLVRLGPGVTLPGTPYRIESWLGDGAMGIVYRAQHVELERTVALKILRPEACGSTKLAEMFRQEARNASRIGSEQIVEIYDLGTLADGRVWFTMPLLHGQSLREALADGPLPPGRAVGLLRQIAKGLAAAHREGIIHRDIKPENIMLVRHHRREDTVRMLDWGVAAAQADAERGSGVMAGTPYYIAPELLLRLPYDHRVDLYSLGCMAYELLTGKPPFSRESVGELLHAHVEDEPPPMAERGGGAVPAALERVVQRCLAKHADDRFEDAAAFEAALCEAQIEAGLHSAWDDLPLPDVDPEQRAQLVERMPDPLRPWWTKRRTRLPLLGGALALVALVLVIALRGPGATAPLSLDRVDALVDEARDAAARAAFVYPPPGDPEAATAYQVVRALERLDEPTAIERATTLRGELAQTLVGLGDRYWSRPGGRPFALDYYVQALVFVPDHEHARQRASLTPGELVDLRRKADAQEFSEAELMAVAPLVALAQDDPQERQRRVDALREDEDTRATVAARLGRLVESEAGVPEARPAPAPKPRERVEPEPEPGEDAVPEDEPADAPKQTSPTAEPSADPPTPPRRDRDRATALVKEANAALVSGALDRAESTFEQALRADSRSAAAHHGLSRVAFHRGRYADAALHGERAIRHAPRSAKYRIDLGDAYYKAYRYEDAAAQYEEAEALGHGGAAARLAKARAKTGG